jgi:hypothetical protein
VYKDFQTQIGGVTSEDLNQYLFLNSLMNQENAKLLFGLQNSIINLGNNANTPLSSNTAATPTTPTGPTNP